MSMADDGAAIPRVPAEVAALHRIAEHADSIEEARDEAGCGPRWHGRRLLMPPQSCRVELSFCPALLRLLAACAARVCN